MNYIGPFLTFSALLTCFTLFLPDRLAGIGRKLALVLAAGMPPFLLGFYYLFFRGEADFPLFYDLKTNYQAALELYQGGGAVYGIQGSYSFPFPTYWFYWLAAGFGEWGAGGTFAAFSLLGLGAWAASFYLLRDTLQTAFQNLTTAQKEIGFLILLAVPVAQSIGQGQTTALVLAGVVLFWLSLEGEIPLLWFLGGVCFALAGLIKPQLALIPVGLLIPAWLVPANRPRVGWSFLGMAAGGLFFLGLTLILPKGVAVSHYRDFFQDVLPNLTPATGEWKVHNSPAYLVSVILVRGGATADFASMGANLTTMMLILAFLWRTKMWVQQGATLSHISALWLVWAVIAPQQSWNFYVAWCLPTFLILIQEAFTRPHSRPRLVLLLLTLAILNVQVADTPLAMFGGGLLAYLVWTYQGKLTI